MNNILGTGIFATLLVACWDRVKMVINYILSFFICSYTFSGNLYKYGAVFCWDKLKNKKSLSPIFVSESFGSGDNQKVFVREIGFINFRFFFIGKIPILCKLDYDGCYIYGLKPFINHEKILLSAIDHYYHNYTDVKRGQEQTRFCTIFKRGMLNANLSNKLARYNTGEVAPDAPEQGISSTRSSISFYESFNIGRRVNFTHEDYISLITFSKHKMIDNLFLTAAMEDMKLKLERWFKNKDWFIQRDIQWKRGVLLHGKPGTGKTSFIVSLAEYFNVPCFLYDLSTMTNNDLEDAWESMKPHTPCFAVFEDFDSVFDGRENVYLKNGNISESKPVSFDCILNIIDGAKKYDGIVTFVTTNNIDKIDSAMGGNNCPRPGRIDYVYEMNGIGIEGKKFIAEKMFAGMDNEQELIQTVLAEAKEGCTPAQFKEMCINIALENYNT